MRQGTLITRDGYLKLMEKLIYLRHVVRPRLIEEMQEARGGFNNVENGELMELRYRLLRLQNTIHSLESKIRGCEILVGVKSYCQRVYVGATVTLKNLESGHVNVYKIVGCYESDVEEGLLSVSSPVGSALIGHGEGDEVMVETPGGLRIYKIISILW